jgi:hypothetical protein
MEIPNAFIGLKDPPSEKEVRAALGPSATAWKELLDWLKLQEIASGEWKSVSPKYGWGLRPVLKKRTILYLGPCEGCFRVSFVLGDKAIAAAKKSDLPKSVLEEIAVSKRHAEGTGVRLFVSRPEDLDPIKTLVEIKLKN